jgi:hypothetical protein
MVPKGLKGKKFNKVVREKGLREAVLGRVSTCGTISVSLLDRKRSCVQRGLHQIAY